MNNTVIRLSPLAFILTFVFAGGLFADPPAGSPVAAHGRLQVVGNRILDEHDEPVQLRGMSYFWSMAGEASGYYNANVVKYLANDWKISVVRAAMGISENWGTTVGYLANKEAEKARIVKVIDGAIEAGIYVIIDWHSHKAETQQADAVEFFKDMADTYKDYPNIIYEIYNEPEGLDANPQGTWQTVKPYMQTVTDAIRAIDPYNIIIIGTPFFCQYPNVAAADPVNGEHLAYSMHFYSASHKDAIRSNTYSALSMGKAVFVSEFGVCKSNGGIPYDFDEADKWMAFMDEHKLSWANWAISRKNEAASALRYTTPPPNYDGGWNTDTDLTESGKYIYGKLTSAVSTEKLFHYITVKIEGEGTVKPLFIRTGSTGLPVEANAYFAYQKTMDTTVTLIATAATGWTFAGWEGDLTGSENDFPIRTNKDWTITAKFTNPLNASYRGQKARAAGWSLANGANGLTLRGPAAVGAKVSVYDVRGRVVKSASLSGSRPFVLNKKSVSAGSYLLVVKNNMGKEVYKTRVSLVN